MNHDHKHEVQVKKVDRLSSTRVKLTVELPAKSVQEHENTTTKRYLNAAKILGFRPGKAPLSIVKERFKEDIKKDVVTHLLQSGLIEALEQTKLSPINQPQIQFENQTFDWEKPFEFHAEFEVEPEIDLKNYKNIPLTKRIDEVTDEDVSKTLENLRDRLSTLEPVEGKKAEKGLFAIVEISSKIEGATEEQPPKPFTVEIGADTLLPEIDKALVGMAIGDKKTVEAKFPETHVDKNLAGKKGTFECHLMELKAKKLPDLDDSFASQIRDGKTLEDLKKEIKENIALTKSDENRREERQEILKYLVEKNKFEVPSTMIENQMKRLAVSVMEDWKQKGLPPPQWETKDIEMLKSRAEEMVRGSLLLRELAVKEKIELDEARVNARVEKIAEQRQKSIDDTLKWLEGKKFLDSLRDEVLTDQVYDFLVQNAKS
jgi:trigger factor